MKNSSWTIFIGALTVATQLCGVEAMAEPNR